MKLLFILQNGGLAFWLGHLLERVHSGLNTKVYALCAYFQEKKRKKKHLIKKKGIRKSGPLKSLDRFTRELSGK
jgi:hypothetical protein